MKSIYIHHHLGLGDHIIANGLVRTIAKEYERVYLFCRPNNFGNVSFLYKDLKKLKIIVMPDHEIQQFIKLNPDNNYALIGHKRYWEVLRSPGNTKKIDEIFYYLASIPVENRWKEFHLERNTTRELEVFKSLGLKLGDKYAFVHDDHRTARKNIPDIKIIKPNNKDYTIFDYLYTIEHAEEIHCINSSFFCLIDCLGIDKQNMFLHEYVRTENRDIGEAETPILNSPWNIIK